MQKLHAKQKTKLSLNLQGNFAYISSNYATLGYWRRHAVMGIGAKKKYQKPKMMKQTNDALITVLINYSILDAIGNPTTAVKAIAWNAASKAAIIAVDGK